MAEDDAPPALPPRDNSPPELPPREAVESLSLAEDVADIALDGVSHEARVDFSTDGSSPYSLLSINGYTQDDVAGNTIVKWDRESNEIVTLFNFFDYFDPSEVPHNGAVPPCAPRHTTSTPFPLLPRTGAPSRRTATGPTPTP